MILHGRERQREFTARQPEVPRESRMPFGPVDEDLRLTAWRNHVDMGWRVIVGVDDHSHLADPHDRGHGSIPERLGY